MKKKNNNEEEKISKIKYVYEAYRQSPAFKALIKLSLYFILCFVIIIVVATSGDLEKETKNDEDNVSTTTKVQKSYHDILNDLLISEKKFSYEITSGDDVYYISYELTNGVQSGLIETSSSSLKKFLIKDNIIYEVVLNEEKENLELFQTLNVNYINIYSLVDILSNNKSFKMLNDDETIYNYNVDNVDIAVTVKEEKIINLEILDSGIKYMISIN